MKQNHIRLRDVLGPPGMRYPCYDVRALGHARPLWKMRGTAQSGRQNDAPYARDAILSQLEAYLFATDEPLSIRKLATLLKLKSSDEVRRQIQRLGGLYEQEGSALQLVELAGGYQLRTRGAFLPWLVKLQPTSSLSLSQAARETLTMIAYRQPINRADLEALRGVSCTDVLRVLLEKGLISIVGRDKTLGRPVQYGTTKLFLQMVGLNRIEDLPPLKD